MNVVADRCPRIPVKRVLAGAARAGAGWYQAPAGGVCASVRRGTAPHASGA